MKAHQTIDVKPLLFTLCIKCQLQLVVAQLLHGACPATTLCIVAAAHTSSKTASENGCSSLPDMCLGAWYPALLTASIKCSDMLLIAGKERLRGPGVAKSNVTLQAYACCKVCSSFTVTPLHVGICVYPMTCHRADMGVLFLLAAVCCQHASRKSTTCCE
jgi:hypothetical protein